MRPGARARSRELSNDERTDGVVLLRGQEREREAEPKSKALVTTERLSLQAESSWQEAGPGGWPFMTSERLNLEADRS